MAAHRRRRWTELRRRNEARCRRILDSSRPLELDDLAWDDAAGVVLDDAVIDALVYMRDVEGFTDRDLVGLSAHRTTLSDPLIRRFLDIWRAEEAVHAQALERFLCRYADGRAGAIPPRQPSPPATASWRDRALARTGGPIGTIVAAAHMTWGAANELLTVNGYRLLADRCGHPALAELLRRIAAQESRHFSFYFLQAQWRLQSSSLARSALRRVLERAWTPVGVGEGYKSAEEFGRVFGYLGSGADGPGIVARMDRRFATLPGMGGLRIFETAGPDLTPA